MTSTTKARRAGRVAALVIGLIAVVAGDRVTTAHAVEAGSFEGCGDVGISSASVNEKSIQVTCGDGTVIAFHL